jgi:hypothetical protein
MLSQIAHTRPKMSAAAEGRHAPEWAHHHHVCIPLFPHFHNLELIK